MDPRHSSLRYEVEDDEGHKRFGQSPTSMVTEMVLAALMCAGGIDVDADNERRQIMKSVILDLGESEANAECRGSMPEC